MNQKHVLFSVAGMTPQIITETLFGLLKREDPVRAGEIHILTTSGGRQSILPLAGENGKIAEFNQAYGTQWEVRPEWIGVIQATDGRELADLRTSVDNEAAANQIVERVREWTQRADIVLHASVAGGRKTMGLFLSQAMSWYARPHDDLSHVLVDEAFEKQKLYFPEPGNAGQADILDFASLPFVRMNGLLPPLLERGKSYADKVKLSQLCLEDLTTATGKLTLDLNKHTLALDGYELLRLSPLSTALYLFLLENANLADNREEFYFRNAFDCRAQLAECMRKVSGIRTQGAGLSALALPESAWPKQWKEEGGRDKQESREEDLAPAFSKLNTDLQRLWFNGNASFQVHSPKSRTGKSRWLNIEPSRIKIVGEE